MKKALLLLIITSWIVGCKNQKEYERGYENGALSTVNYNYHKGDYPSMGFRNYLSKRRIKLPHDEARIDSIYKAYISRWEDYAKTLESVYSQDSIWMRNNDTTGWRGEGYSEDTISGDLIYNGPSRLPIGATGQVLPMPIGVHPEWAIKDTVLKSKWSDGVRLGPRTSEMYFEGDAIGGEKRIILDKSGKPIQWVENSGYALAVDSLGNIIEDSLRTPGNYILALDTLWIPKWRKKDSLP